MTTLDLICVAPFEIGLMATSNFAGLTIGSLLFIRYTDIIGRKPVVLLVSTVTAVGIYSMMLFGDTLLKVYIIIFVIGSVYSARASVTYVYATEFLPERFHMLYGVC